MGSATQREVSNEFFITVDKKEQYDILTRVTYLEQETGDRKDISFETIRKIDRGTQHNWHKLLREAFSLYHQESESKEANGVSGAEKDNKVKELEEGEK